MDIDTLRKVAEAATPGPWAATEEVDGVYAGRRTVVQRTEAGPYAPRRILSVGQTRPHVHEDGEANAAFVATFDPEMVGALLDVVAAANEIVSPDYRTAPEPYASGVRLDDMRDLMDALDRLA